MMWIVPVAAVIGFAAAPPATRERLTSLVNPQSEDSNRHRIVTFRTGAEMIKAHPWFGLGPEQIGKQFLSYVPADVQRPLPVGYYGHLHNIYLQYAAERGIPAMLVMMWLIAEMLWDCATCLRRLSPGPSQARFVLDGAIAFTIAILVEGLFEFNLGDSEVLMMFVSVLALAYAAIRSVETKERENSAGRPALIPCYGSCRTLGSREPRHLYSTGAWPHALHELRPEQTTHSPRGSRTLR